MKILLFTLSLALILAIAIYVYFGGLKKVSCRIENQGGELLAYKPMTGDYSKSGALMDEIYYTLLNNYDIETYCGFGIYFDNPKNVEKSKLRSEIGCIVEKRDSSKVSQIQEGIQVKTFPLNSYLVTEFPYKGKLSVLFSLMKVYPAIDKYVKNNGYNTRGAIMEIYDMKNKKIIYRKEIAD